MTDTNTKRAQRGAWLLAEYCGRYEPGSENTEDPEGAYTIATDIVADLLHALDALDHPGPAAALDMGTRHGRRSVFTKETRFSSPIQ